MGPGVCAIFSRKIRRSSAYLPFWLNVDWKNNFVKEEKPILTAFISIQPSRKLAGSLW